jgi:hypothetical protein
MSEIANEFWRDVEHALEHAHGWSREQAIIVATSYREWLDTRRVRDLVAHEEPEEFAATIAERKKERIQIPFDRLTARTFLHKASEKPQQIALALAEFPLPGGREAFYKTLLGMLKCVSSRRVSVASVIDFLMTNTPTKSRYAARRYIGSVAVMKLWTLHGDGLSLTPAGDEILHRSYYAPEQAMTFMLYVKFTTIAAYVPLWNTIAEHPTTVQVLHPVLEQAVQTTWASDNQTRHRLNWLLSLGFVKEDNHIYSLTDSAKEVT